MRINVLFVEKKEKKLLFRACWLVVPLGRRAREASGTNCCDVCGQTERILGKAGLPTHVGTCFDDSQGKTPVPPLPLGNPRLRECVHAGESKEKNDPEVTNTTTVRPVMKFVLLVLTLAVAIAAGQNEGESIEEDEEDSYYDEYSGEYEYDYGEEEDLDDVGPKMSFLEPKMVSVPLAVEANVGERVEFPCDAEVSCKHGQFSSFLLQVPRSVWEWGKNVIVPPARRE